MNVGLHTWRFVLFVVVCAGAGAWFGSALFMGRMAREELSCVVSRLMDDPGVGGAALRPRIMAESRGVMARYFGDSFDDGTGLRVLLAGAVYDAVLRRAWKDGGRFLGVRLEIAAARLGGKAQALAEALISAVAETPGPAEIPIEAAWRYVTLAECLDAGGVLPQVPLQRVVLDLREGGRGAYAEDARRALAAAARADTGGRYTGLRLHLEAKLLARTGREPEAARLLEEAARLGAP